MTFGAYFDIPRSLGRFWSQILVAFFVACVRAAYSALVVDSIIVDYFFACHEIDDPARMKMYTDIDFLSLSTAHPPIVHEFARVNHSHDSITSQLSEEY